MIALTNFFDRKVAAALQFLTRWHDVLLGLLYLTLAMHYPWPWGFACLGIGILYLLK